MPKLCARLNYLSMTGLRSWLLQRRPDYGARIGRYWLLRHHAARAPIGSGLGIQNPRQYSPDCGTSQGARAGRCRVGTASDAAVAMELGCDGVLMNTAIAEAKDPLQMARAMRHAVIAGRQAYLAGRMAKRLYADPSSPLAGLI
ncbi:MAG: hypothetical protein CM15mP21_4500 [Hyphomicrobiales bacterium]|nr:MAG: hypothetical protein CM15mP21_4500 [Hyphomicrobiales bacterium]